jgi:CheY-like chemotaxis protein
MTRTNLPRLLIVEDEFLVRLTLAEFLGEEGFEALEAASGDEALVLLDQGETVDLLLTDLQLAGGMDGRTLATRARERQPDLPVIYMTGRPDSAPATSRTGRDMVIAKPYLPSEVAAAARRMINR